MKQPHEIRKVRPAETPTTIIVLGWTAILFSSFVMEYADGFWPLQSQFIRHQSYLHPDLRSTASCISAKPRKTGDNNSNNKRQGTPARASKASKSAKSIKTASPPVAISSSSTVGKEASSRSVPPWQVLSPTDAKKNIAREQERRARMQDGLSHDEDDELQSERVELSKVFINTSERSLLKWKRFNPVTAPAGMQLVASLLGKSSKLPSPLGVPEIAFLGRSNVGKSSLLNKLARNDAARVGKTPGATASVNVYALHDAKEHTLLGFVDLPGFGYAKLSKSVQQDVQEAAERYLGQRKELVLGILLVDIRRVPSDDDRAVLAAVYDLGVPIVVVTTKVDKVSMTERERQLEEIRLGLGLPEGQPLCVSSVTGEGTKQLWRIMLEACETGVKDFQQKLVRGGSIDDDDTREGQEVDSKEMYFDDDDDDDGEDPVYSQGYDWIHDTAVVYEQDEDDDFYIDEDGDLNNQQHQPPDQPLKESIKSLKQKAWRMERGGQV